MFQGLPSVFAERLAEDDSFWNAATAWRPLIRGRARFADSAYSCEPLLLDGGGDHQLLPGRHDLDREVADEVEPPRDCVADVGPVLSDPAGEREYIQAAEGHGHVRHSSRNPIREDGEAERIVQAAEGAEPGSCSNASSSSSGVRPCSRRT